MNKIKVNSVNDRKMYSKCSYCLTFGYKQFLQKVEKNLP